MIFIENHLTFYSSINKNRQLSYFSGFDIHSPHQILSKQENVLFFSQQIHYFFPCRVDENSTGTYAENDNVSGSLLCNILISGHEKASACGGLVTLNTPY